MHARQGLQACRQGSTGKQGTREAVVEGSAFPFRFSSLEDVATSNHLQLPPRQPQTPEPAP